MMHTSSLPLRRLLVYAASKSALVAACGVPACAVVAQQPLLLSPSHGPAHMMAARATMVTAAPEAPQGGNGASLKDDLFAGTEKFAKGATEATEVNMDPDSLNLVGGANAGRAHKTILNVVRTYSYDKPGMYNPADVDEYRRKLETGDWHCSIHTRDLKSGESTDICNRRRPPDMIETAIITVEPKELTFIHTIRKADGQGGHVGGEDLDGMLSGSPAEATMAAASSRMETQMLATEARMAALSARLSAASLPSMAALQERLQTQLGGTYQQRELEQAAESLRRRMQQLPQ